MKELMGVYQSVSQNFEIFELLPGYVALATNADQRRCIFPRWRYTTDLNFKKGAFLLFRHRYRGTAALDANDFLLRRLLQLVVPHRCVSQEFNRTV